MAYFYLRIIKKQYPELNFRTELVLQGCHDISLNKKLRCKILFGACWNMNDWNRPARSVIIKEKSLVYASSDVEKISIYIFIFKYGDQILYSLRSEMTVRFLNMGMGSDVVV